MRIPGPGDLIKLSGQGLQALERAISLVPRLVVTEIESTQHRATAAVSRIEPLLDRFEPTLDKLEPIIARLAETTSPATAARARQPTAGSPPRLESGVRRHRIIQVRRGVEHGAIEIRVGQRIARVGNPPAP